MALSQRSCRCVISLDTHFMKDFFSILDATDALLSMSPSIAFRVD
jgi:hypothetical protein